MANIPISSFTAAANTTGIGMSGFSLTGSNAQSIIDLAGTWNTSGTPTGVKLNVTDTASNAASLLMDLQTGGVSRFSVNKAGVVTLPAGASNSAPSLRIGTDVGLWSRTSGSLNFGGIGNNTFEMVSGEGIRMGTSQISWATSVGGSDLIITRDAANTLAQRNGVNAQTSRIYNTYTDASNYERGKMEWASNVLRIGTEKAGTGTARALELQTDGTTRLTIGATGQLLVGLGTAAAPSIAFLGDENTGIYSVAADNISFAVGGTERYRMGSGGQFTASGGLAFGNNTGTPWGRIDALATGVIIVSNQSQTDFIRLQLGGTTNSFGAVARDGAGVSFVGAAGGSTAHIKVPGVTVANLPAAATAGAGARSFVTDALAPTFGSAVTGGGAVNVPVYSTGSAWNVG